jgi:mono/diheme cytochrome c family protein
MPCPVPSTRPRRAPLAALTLLTPLLLASLATTAQAAAAPEPVDFSRQIRPLLSKNCIACHGPDEKHRKGGLRLDTAEGAFREKDGTRAVVPGKLNDSEAWKRIVTKDADDLMPPPDSGKALTRDEIALVRRWIEEGASFRGHWAFDRPSRPTPPASAFPDRSRSPIDAFVHARLVKEGLTPSPQAAPHELARRVALDLTGLPPSLEDVDAFTRDPSDTAYERLVDKLLAQPSYGERWARPWLDLARYADSKGYEKDKARVIWRWRDWVIDALNRDLPYDRFSVEQLAGDLLPNATPAQRLATAFHRNTLTNDEGGTDDEEFRVAAVKDRVDTTLQVWMGLTGGCAKCHDHKYDPIAMRDYYRLLAVFNQTEDADKGSDEPLEPFPTLAQEKERQELDAKVAAADAAVDKALGRGKVALATWQRQWKARFSATELKALAAAVREGKVVPAKLGGWRILGPLTTPGPEGDAATHRFAIERDAGKATEQEHEGKKWTDCEGLRAAFFLGRSIEVAHARQVRVSLAASQSMRVWLDGKVIADGTSSVSSSDRAGRIDLPAGKHQLLVKIPNPSGPASFLFRLDGEEIEGEPLDVVRALARDEAQPKDVKDAKDKAKREADRRADLVRLRDHFLRRDGKLAAAELAALDKARGERERLERAIPRIPVMRELLNDKRRKSHVHVRGNFLEKGEAVEPGVPTAFHPLHPPAAGPAPAGATVDRLALARWLMDERNPLTARVFVNRLWAQLFGAGLVETEEDFGSQGLPPSHPELLDWLATEAVRLGWSQKGLLKTIVTSATYRQSSRASAALVKRDRFNKWLARGPRFRLEAEAVRDVVLAVSGLLSRKQYGPSVMPPQPEGIWAAVYSGDRWITPSNEDRYRRGLYTWTRRTSPYPSMITFDAPSREICTIRRIRSNTPLQALVTLNDPVYVEAAQALARRMLREADGSVESRIGFALRLALQRPADEAETGELAKLYEKRLAHYRAHPDDAKAFAGQPGLGPTADVPLAEAAAYTAVANVILNLDELLTKG